VDVKLAKALDEGKLSRGYTLRTDVRAGCHVGPWANVRQAYVESAANVGNGLDFKIGQWDNILVMNPPTATKNARNWTRSYGYTIEGDRTHRVLAAI